MKNSFRISMVLLGIASCMFTSCQKDSDDPKPINECKCPLDNPNEEPKEDPKSDKETVEAYLITNRWKTIDIDSNLPIAHPSGMHFTSATDVTVYESYDDTKPFDNTASNALKYEVSEDGEELTIGSKVYQITEISDKKMQIKNSKSSYTLKNVSLD